MSIPSLIELFHHRWAAPVLAELRREKGTRFVLLTNRLGVGRESLRRTLEALIASGHVARNPGYGHPLRPEYVLTPAGRAVAERCDRLLAALGSRADVGLKKWSMPLLAALDGPKRFTELRNTLPGVTPRALALALKDAQSAGWVERRIVDEYPPTSIYRTTTAGTLIRAIL